MGVIFFSSLTMLCGGALFKRARERRRFLKRYANRLAKIVENNAAIQAHFLKNPKDVVARERRFCGREICVELSFLPEENVIDVAVSEAGTLSNYCPVGARAFLAKRRNAPAA